MREDDRLQAAAAARPRVRASRLGHVPALDGLRGVAIALVVANHFCGWPFGGWLGVDLFFVLSGFLITTLLMEEHAETGRIRLLAFYGRRARRLLPALAVLLAGYLVIDAFRGTDGLGLVASMGLYTGNIYEAFWPGVSTHIVGLNHLWSLAEEEQFYVVWPAALLIARKMRKPDVVLVAVAVALVVYRAALVAHGASGARLYFAPDTHLDGLVLGSALAFARLRRPVALARAVVVAACVAAELLVLVSKSLPVTNAVVLPLFELAAVVLVAHAVNGSLRLPRLLVWLGGISYSLYLWHYVVLWAFHRHDRLLALAISVALAYASTRWIERPFRRRRTTAKARAPVVAPQPA